MKKSKFILAAVYSSLLLLFSLGAVAQSIKVSGEVKDSKGDPLVSVTVAEVGTSNATVTNQEGKFAFTVASLNAELQVSTVGYETLTVPLNGKTAISITLNLQINSLTEVVVVGYGEQKKKSVTGAVSQVSGDAINVVPAANASQLLAGRMPGLVTKTNSSLPGNDGAALQIRGFGTALIIVDGLPTPFNRVDPNDIESISILKDASAAIYGAQAGNGVVLVTTKRGKTGPPVITYSGTYTSQNATAFQTQVNAGDYAQLRREASLNYGLNPGEFTEEIVQKFKDGTDPNYRSYSWKDALFRSNAPMYQQSLSVRGGTSNIRYFASVGITDQQSVYSSGDYFYKRYNARLNIDATISKNLSFRFDLQYRHEQSQQVGDVATVMNDFATAQPRYSPYLPDPTKNGYSGFSERNPLLRSQADRKGYNRTATDFFSGQLSLEYKLPFVEGLKVGVDLLVSQNFVYNKQLSLPAELHTYDYETEVYTYLANMGSTISLRESQTRGYQIYPRARVEYKRSVGEHDFSGMVIAEQIQNGGNNFYAFRRDLLSPEIQQLFSGGQDFQDNSGSASKDARVSYISRLNYGYMDKYLAEFILRADASVNFPKDTRWGYFPGVSLGWRFSKEGFMENASDWLDDAKLRFSYGKSGNDNTSQFSYLTGYNINTSGYIFGPTLDPAIQITGLSNPNISWEKITNINAGLDFTILGGKITFEGNVFYRKREGILATPILGFPSTFGATLPPVNLNSIENRGFEFLLTYAPKLGKVELFFTPSVTVTSQKWLYRDEVEYTDPDQIRLNKLTGRSTNLETGYLSDGIFMSQGEIDKLSFNQDQLGNTSLRPGDIRYVDLNGDGILDWRDQTFIGKGTFPEVVYSLIMGGRYKNLSWELLWQGATGFDFYVGGEAASMFSNESIPLDYQAKYRWQPDPNDPTSNINPEAKLPAASLGLNPNNIIHSDFWLKDATFLRLKSANISYDLGKNGLNKIGFKNVQVYVAATNIFMISKLGIYKNSFDPDANVNGSGRNYPIHRNVSIGIRFSL